MQGHCYNHFPWLQKARSTRHLLHHGRLQVHTPLSTVQPVQSQALYCQRRRFQRVSFSFAKDTWWRRAGKLIKPSAYGTVRPGTSKVKHQNLLTVNSIAKPVQVAAPPDNKPGDYSPEHLQASPPVPTLQVPQNVDQQTLAHSPLHVAPINSDSDPRALHMYHYRRLQFQVHIFNNMGTTSNSSTKSSNSARFAHSRNKSPFLTQIVLDHDGC